jgi:glucose-6-phosphate 1-dehydrogenase
VLFRKAPHLPFAKTDTEELGSNQLVVRVQPDEGVTLRFGSKVPGTTMEVRDVAMDFQYGEAFTVASPRRTSGCCWTSCSGRLAVPAQRGGRGELARHRPDRGALGEQTAAGGQPHLYRAGEWGPRAADEMLARDGRVWRRP